ncbi:MAG: hypothetical protein DME99_03200 [Verrucomicrobia bacterium]|nr:MAG: hypothetical protein DME99_03200 [Verrucomicrobiota bacterium]
MKLRFNSRDSAPSELDGDGRFVLSRRRFVPAYVKALEKAILQERAQQAVESLQSCRICPRDTYVNANGLILSRLQSQSRATLRGDQSAHVG